MLKLLKSPSLLSAAISVALLAPIAHADQERGNVEKAGDVGAYLTPITALALTYLEDDPDGRWQFLISWSASNLTVQGIKNVVDKRRPNFDIDEQNPEVGANSFPSGHASAAFGGASFIYTRYGKK